MSRRQTRAEALEDLRRALRELRDVLFAALGIYRVMAAVERFLYHRGWIK
jgi:hypothetical protein